MDRLGDLINRIWRASQNKGEPVKKEADRRPKWMECVQPLMDHFRKLRAVMTWEGYASLDWDHPSKKDVIIQHWYTLGEPDESGRRPCRYYVVTIFADGGGWNVHSPVHPGNDIEATLEAIK